MFLSDEDYELHLSAYNGDVAAVRRLLVAGVAPDTRGPEGFTPLLWASFRAAVTDMVPVMSALVAAGADPDAITGPGDANCLILAAQSGNAASVAALIALGAQVDGAADGVTALMQAARDGSDEIVLLLLRAGARKEMRCGSFTAADYAAYGGHDGIAEMIAGFGE